MQSRTVRAAALAASLAALAGQAGAQGIYTCTDSKGRRITADRPIIDCIDREQTELSTGGMPRRKIGPSLTAAERAAEEDKARRAAEERARANEEKKRDRALVTRYPNLAAHDKEREASLARLDASKATAQKRIVELLAQRKTLEGEMEFYKANPARVPLKLRHQAEEVDTQLAGRTRFIAEQEAEKTQVNARFDEELARLKVLWAQQAPVPTVARAASAPAAPAKTVR